MEVFIAIKGAHYAGEFFKDDGKRGLFCPNHPEQKATTFRIAFKGLWLRFTNYDDAQQVLSGMQFKFREDSFDDRDYRKDQPLGFSSLADQFLIYKATVEKKRSTGKMVYHLNYARNFFQNRNIKDIGEGELQDLLAFLPPHLSDKRLRRIFLLRFKVFGYGCKSGKEKRIRFLSFLNFLLASISLNGGRLLISLPRGR